MVSSTQRKMASPVMLDDAAYQVIFQPNMAFLIHEHPELFHKEAFGSSSCDRNSSTCSLADSTNREDDAVGDAKKKTKNKRFGLPLPTKLKKKLKSRTNKKRKGKKSKMTSLAKSAVEPSKKLIEKWKSMSLKKQEAEFSGSLFAGRLEDEDTISKLPTIREDSYALQDSPSSPHENGINPNPVADERKLPISKKWKSVKRFFKNLKSSRNSGADAFTVSTTCSPRTMGDDNSHHDDDDASHDLTELALASASDETFFSLKSELSTMHQEDLQVSSPCSNPSNELPPSLTLVQPPSSSSSVARQASCVANIVWNGRVPQEYDYPSDEEDASVDSMVTPTQEESSVDSDIVSPVPSPPVIPTESPRKKILNYKKTKKTKAHVVKPTTVAAFPRNVRALLSLVTVVLCALYVWRKCCDLPQGVLKLPTTTAAWSLMTSGANILSSKSSFEMEDSEWPFDEC